MFPCYILDGHRPVKVPYLVWVRWFGNNDAKRRVAETTIGKVWVSTVFLGVDQNYFRRGRPTLFETMVFLSRNKPLPGGTKRYATWKEAEAGHAATVRQISARNVIAEVLKTKRVKRKPQ